MSIAPLAPSVLRGIAAETAMWRGSVVTIGNFDGVHLGHRAILMRCRTRAVETGARVVAVTFEPHPLAILTPDRAPARLATLEERVESLHASGADAVWIIDTDRAFLSWTPEEFVERLIVERLAACCVVEGLDFNFGRGRQGSIETLRELGDRFQFAIDVVEPLRVRLGAVERVVSSSAIRERLLAGDVEAAAACLGRDYALSGTVTPGSGAGRELGFPTINLASPPTAVPGDGVYAGTGRIAGWTFAAAISIGHRPTMGGTTRAIEAHLLDASGAWYGQSARLGFRCRLRDQQRFEDIEHLREQIERDVARVRELIGPTGTTV